MESLETRQVLSTVVVGPTPDQQYALELINLVRTNPSEAATKFTTDITPDVQATLDHFGVTAAELKSELASATPQPPLAWSDALGSSAQSQSQYQADNGVQTHQGPGESGLGDRIASAGYTNASTFGENTYAYADSTDEAMQSFLFDWGVADHGHYKNLLQPGTSAEDSYKDVGIGLVNTTSQGLGPVVVTQDFGSKNNEGPQILGVVYDDPTNSGFYAPGQGQSGVTIDVLNVATGADLQTTSTNSGGYQIPVGSNADYTVTATENGHVISSQRVHVGDVNVKADFVHNPANDQTSAPTPAPTPTPAPAPTPVQSQAQVVATVASTPTPQPSTPPASAPQQAPQDSSDQQAQVLIPVQQAQATSSPSQDSSSDSSTVDLSGWGHWFAHRSGN